jgi:hypothetical protein
MVAKDTHRPTSDGSNRHFDMTQPGWNCKLGYRVGGKTYEARVRVPQAGYTYGVTASQSQARTLNAFYPHRRALGQFTITVDCNGYHEFRKFMNWMRNYAATLMSQPMTDQRGAVLMEVYLPSRRFHKAGVLAAGIHEDQHVGAMLWSPQFVFATVQDFNDPSISILRVQQTSRFFAPKNDKGSVLNGFGHAESSAALYPATTAKYTDEILYNGPIEDPGSRTKPVGWE